MKISKISLCLVVSLFASVSYASSDTFEYLIPKTDAIAHCSEPFAPVSVDTSKSGAYYLAETSYEIIDSPDPLKLATWRADQICQYLGQGVGYSISMRSVDCQHGCSLWGFSPGQGQYPVQGTFYNYGSAMPTVFQSVQCVNNCSP